ncbi:MAG TPA: type VI secretion system tube protein Hcp [Gaiellaceae bacterium]|jgi:type VI secretion system secreted protein Hcp
MALNAYLKLTGQKQGDIKGSTTQKGREGQIQVMSFSFGTESTEGQIDPTEFMVALDADQSTPLILNAFVQNENLTTCELDLYGENEAGEEILQQKWELTNAQVASFRSGAVVGSANGPANEVTFSFERLQQTWLDGGLTAEWDVNQQK